MILKILVKTAVILYANLFALIRKHPQNTQDYNVNCFWWASTHGYTCKRLHFKSDI